VPTVKRWNRNAYTHEGYADYKQQKQSVYGVLRMDSRPSQDNRQALNIKTLQK
jgi:hypothetical protein